LNFFTAVSIIHQNATQVAEFFHWLHLITIYHQLLTAIHFVFATFIESPTFPAQQASESMIV